MAKPPVIMTAAKRRMYELDAATIAFYRRNPCIACEDLLGIRLVDNQKYILQSTWNASHSVWCCSRDLGKTFLGAILIILKALLYENQAIYIVASVGPQSKETFSKIEEIILRSGKTSASIRSLKDIAEKETVKSPNNRTGFSHSSVGWHVKFYNGSEIFTLNSRPDSTRSRRANLVFFDEAAFCSDELIVVCEAFATQNTDFITDVDHSYNPETEPKRVPTQLVYASSQGEMDTIFYKHYKNFAKRMLAGDRDYFVCDMPCDVAMQTYMNGEPYTPLLTKSKVDAALKSNREKALREYYNLPTKDGGITQIIKWGTIRRNEKLIIPHLHHQKGGKYIIAFDPARTYDNSVVSVMFAYNDEELGWCGDIVNCASLVDIASKKKYKLDSNRQIEEIRNLIVAYNGHNPDYEYIDCLLIDQGSGGGGISTYADNLLNDWVDKSGMQHRGFIDASHDIYEGYSAMYPDAVDKLRLISPRKYRTQMVEEFIELMNLGVIKFPYEYSGREYLRIPRGVDTKTGEEIYENYDLNADEQLALVNIDLMKTEITSIHRYTNPEKTSISYALAKDRENKMFDDRFYTAIMLAHRLYELRRGQVISKPKVTNNFNFKFRPPQIRAI